MQNSENILLSLKRHNQTNVRLHFLMCQYKLYKETEQEKTWMIKSLSQAYNLLWIVVLEISYIYIYTHTHHMAKSMRTPTHHIPKPIGIKKSDSLIAYTASSVLSIIFWMADKTSFHLEANSAWNKIHKWNNIHQPQRHNHAKTKKGLTKLIKQHWKTVSPLDYLCYILLLYVRYLFTEPRSPAKN